MTAAKLREAASLMRERAEAATPGPWEAFRRGDPRGPFGVCAESAGDVDPDVFEGASREDAAHIASWHPAVALAVADMLDVLADRAEEIADTIGSPRVAAATIAENLTGWTEALAVAAAYLGSAS